MSTEEPPNQQPQLGEQESSQLQLTVLYGSHSSSSTAVCYLLEISGVKILLDCGWDTNYDPALLEPLKLIADKIQLVLISHADLEHMGALAYAYKNFQLKAQCWCTKPVLKFGHLNMYDAVLNGTAPFTLDDVDQCILRCKECAFQQELKVKHGEGQGEILVTARASGRSMGGAIWSVVNEESALNVQYSSDTYLRREALLDGMDLAAMTKDPTLLILDCLGVTGRPVPQYGGETKERLLLRALEDTLKRGGDVLIPTPCTSRVIEVLLLLNEEWTRNSVLRQFDLVLLTRVSSILGVAENHVEWVSRRLQEIDVTTKDSPLRFPNVQVVDSFEDAFPPAATKRGRPGRVVICGGSDLEQSSFSREAFIREISHRSNCLVMLLFSSCIKTSVAMQLANKSRLIEMEEERWVDLTGEELVEWTKKRDLQQLERQREQENEVEMEKFEIMEEEEDSAVGGTTVSGVVVKQLAYYTDRSLFKDAHNKDETFTFVPQFLEEEHVGWDEYGAIFDTHGLMKKSLEDGPRSTMTTTPQHQQQQQSTTMNKSSSLQDMGPRKKERITVRHPVLCQVAFLDFDGRNSRGDLLEIVDQIKPKKLVVVRCAQRESEAFGFDCQSKASCGVALTPSPGETLDVAADSSVVRVRIPDETLQTSSSAVTFGGFTIQRIRGKMALMSSLAAASTTTTATGKQPEKRRRVLVTAGEVPSIVSLREDGDGGGSGGKKEKSEEEVLDRGECAWVSKNKEPDLTFVLKKLKQNNVPVLLVSSVLMCGHNQEVQVWKPADGRMLVSGPLCDLYYETRKIVYSCFALI
ncbi:hypothetical protein BASA81_002118 [Batrachochytrium salamandrivorans]|nr:hypothetical protein BASA81_002118 [Batrachochytrium salamandrivorans]